MCTQGPSSQQNAQLKAALARRATHQAELQTALARQAALKDAEEDFRFLVQWVIADMDQAGGKGNYKLSTAYEALDKQEQRICKLTQDYRQIQVSTDLV